jgi:hypothetical protein
MNGLGVFVLFILICNSQYGHTAKFGIQGDQQAIDQTLIDQNIVIVNLKKYRRGEFVFTCSCDNKNCLDLNYTFTSHDTISVSV